MMWTQWGGAWAGSAAAVGMALLLARPAGSLAWALPVELEPELERRSRDRHRRWRLLFQAAALVLLVLAGWRLRLTPALLGACLFIIGGLLLAWIDAETGYLPDRLTLPLLWLGLLVNLGDTFATLPMAVLGAALGYAVLWAINQAFLLSTGRHGMGYGDFKLLAALGAWLGAPALPTVVLAGSLLGLLAALVLRLTGRMQAGQALHFGPYLVAGGLFALFTSSDFL